MVVTVVISQVPPSVSLEVFANDLKKLLFTNEDIVKFRVRLVSKKKHKIAVDFNSGFDAMYAQEKLDKKQYMMPNGETTKLHAKVTRDPYLKTERPLTPEKKLEYGEPISSCVYDLPMPLIEQSDHRQEKQIDIGDKLKVLQAAQQVLFEEKEKVKKKYEYRFEDDHRRKRRRSDSRDSDEHWKKKSSRDMGKSNSSDLRDRSSHDLKDRSSHDPSDSNSHDLRDRSSHDLRVSCPRDGGERFSYDLRDKIRHTSRSHTPRETSRSHTPRETSRSHTPRETSSRTSSKDSCGRSRHGRSESRESYYRISSNASERWPPSKYESGDRNISTPSPYSMRKQFRPNISEDYNSETENSYMNKRYHKNKQSIKQEVKIEVKEEVNITRDGIHTKKDEAIKDILLETEGSFSEISAKHNISGAEKKRVLQRLFEVVDKRMSTLKITNDMSVSNLVMHYRCKYSKIEDNDMVMDLFNELISDRNDCIEVPLSPPNEDSIWSVVDSVLNEFELDSLTEDVKPKIETPDTHVTKITININPIINYEKTDTQYKMSDDNYHYYINILMDPNRPKKYFITISKLLKQLKPHMEKYREYIEMDVFKYVIREILEKQIKYILVGRKYMKAKAVLALYREFYPVRGDHDFVLKILHEIWEGKYNDGNREIADTTTGAIKTESDDSTVPVAKEIKKETEIASSQIDNDSMLVEECANGFEKGAIKTESEDSTVRVAKEIKKETETTTSQIDNDSTSVEETANGFEKGAKETESGESTVPVAKEIKKETDTVTISDNGSMFANKEESANAVEKGAKETEIGDSTLPAAKDIKKETATTTALAKKDKDSTFIEERANVIKNGAVETESGDSTVAVTKVIKKETETVTTEKDDDDDFDDDLFSNKNDLINGNISSSNAAQSAQTPTPTADVIVVETKIEVIEISDTDASPIVKKETIHTSPQIIKMEQCTDNEVVDLSTDDEDIDVNKSIKQQSHNATPIVNTEPVDIKPKTIKKEICTAMTVVDLSADDDVLDINASSEGEFNTSGDKKVRTEVAEDTKVSVIKTTNDPNLTADTLQSNYNITAITNIQRIKLYEQMSEMETANRQKIIPAVKDVIRHRISNIKLAFCDAGFADIVQKYAELFPPESNENLIKTLYLSSLEEFNLMKWNKYKVVFTGAQNGNRPDSTDEVICISDNDEAIEINDVKRNSDSKSSDRTGSVSLKSDIICAQQERKLTEECTSAENDLDVNVYNVSISSVETVILDEQEEIDVSEVNLHAISKPNESYVSEQDSEKTRVEINSKDDSLKPSHLNVDITEVSLKNSKDNAVLNNNLISDKETFKDKCNKMDSSNENVGPNVGDEIIVSCAERNSDFNDEGIESVETIRNYMQSMFGSTNQ